MTGRQGVEEVGRGHAPRDATLPAAVAEQVPQHERQDRVRREHRPVPVHDAEAVGVAVGGESEVRLPLAHHPDQLAEVLLGRLRRMAAEDDVTRPVEQRNLAPRLFEQAVQVAARRPVHDVHHHAQARPAKPLEVDQQYVTVSSSDNHHPVVRAELAEAEVLELDRERHAPPNWNASTPLRDDAGWLSVRSANTCPLIMLTIRPPLAMMTASFQSFSFSSPPSIFGRLRQVADRKVALGGGGRLLAGVGANFFPTRHARRVQQPAALARRVAEVLLACPRLPCRPAACPADLRGTSGPDELGIPPVSL